MENLIPTLYGWVVILCQLLALFAIVIGIAQGFVIYYPKQSRSPKLNYKLFNTPTK